MATNRTGGVLVSVLLVGLACDAPSEPEDVSLTVQPAALLSHLQVLAADSLLGRGSGSADESRAAEYIRAAFTAYGLQPGASEYQQRFAIPFPVRGQSGLQSQNVLGILPGAGALSGQWIVVGAHYDHVGIGASVESDSIYNGADDNASGTALVLELARVFAARYSAAARGSNRRSIMFQTYGAEEVGLIGSTHFCNHPTVPMDSIVAMINFDMVGRLEDRTLALIGTSSSSDWAELIAAVNTRALPLTDTLRLGANSDHWCFFTQARPVLMFHTGLHEQYHQPMDQVGLIDLRGMEEIGAFAASLIVELIGRTERLSFTGGP